MLLTWGSFIDAFFFLSSSSQFTPALLQCMFRYNVHCHVAHESLLGVSLAFNKLWKRSTSPSSSGRAQGQPWTVLYIISEALWFLVFFYISIFLFLRLWNFDRIYTLMWLFHFEARDIQLIWMLTPAKLFHFKNVDIKKLTVHVFFIKLMKVTNYFIESS